ncbi:MAG: hypothetical protein ACPGJU_05475 [Coraliomargarita sp.]
MQNQCGQVMVANEGQFGAKLQERSLELGVPCELVYPRAPDVKFKTPLALRLGSGP